MERESVNRLYSHGIQRKQSAMLRAEAEVYPSRPPVVRTPQQVTEYVEKVVKPDLERRHRHLVELDRQVYSDPCALDPRPLSAARLESHVKHMYEDQVNRFRRTREARLKEYGAEDQQQQHRTATVARSASASGGRGGIQQLDINKEREAKWRPVAASPKRKDAFLHQKPSHPATGAEQKSPGRGEQRMDLEEINKYFARLSKPLRVWPKADAAKRVDLREEGFNLYTSKFRKS
jgi:hypothetical protein